jgi:hypothetical protein
MVSKGDGSVSLYTSMFKEENPNETRIARCDWEKKKSDWNSNQNHNRRWHSMNEPKTKNKNKVSDWDTHMLIWSSWIATLNLKHPKLSTCRQTPQQATQNIIVLETLQLKRLTLWKRLKVGGFATK